MKKLYSTLYILFLFPLNIEAQQNIQASIGAINRPTPKIGFNSNGHMPANFPVGNLGANWTQPEFINNTAFLNPGVLRYPGGTNANHWDWQTGWYKPGYQPPFPALSIRVDEFKNGLDASASEGLYVLNTETSTATYEMDGLRHIVSLGMNPIMFELGNEHNLSNSNYPLQFMSSTNYALIAKAYSDSIKANIPNAKVCVVGSNTGQRPNWHSDILSQLPSVDAFAWHAYTNANNADLVFDLNRALSVAFGNSSYSGSLANRYQLGGFAALPSDKEVWVTEYNLWETQISSSPVIAGSWAHLLYLNGLNHYFLSNPRVTMFLNHSLASIDPWHESISRQDQHVTANGMAMKLLLDVSKGSQTSQDISFSGNPSMVYGPTVIPKLTGWKFNYTGGEKGFICNYSADTFNISLKDVFSGTMQFEQYSADPTLVVNGFSNLTQYSGNSTDSITIYPFSFTQINPTLVLTSPSNNYVNNQFVVSPNPFSETTLIQSTIDMQNANLIIYNTLGEVVKQIDGISGKTVTINRGNLAGGIYFMKLSQDNKVIANKKLMVLK